MENNRQYGTIGDLKAKNLIMDIQNATLLFSIDNTSSLEMTNDDLIKLRDSAANLITILNKSLDKMHPDLRAQLESEKWSARKL